MKGEFMLASGLMCHSDTEFNKSQQEIQKEGAHH